MGCAETMRCATVHRPPPLGSRRPFAGRSRGARRGVAIAARATVLGVLVAAGARAQSTEELVELSLEDLGRVVVTSVTRTPTSLADAAAAIYVITAEDIRRSGARTLAEALRLAPNLQVARRGSTAWAITARGFNNSIGNKLLVLVDGRTIYTPLFSGVFWEQQDLVLEDVERIEVISGPGGTLWGTNAVNGVINVLTKSAGATRGPMASAEAGNDWRQGAVRWGGALPVVGAGGAGGAGGAEGAGGEAGAWRLYARAAETDATELESGAEALDAWRHAQAGFRVDWSAGDDEWTVQGDAYDGRSEDRGAVGPFVLGRVEVEGANLLARWIRRTPADGRWLPGSELRVQAYYDYSVHDDRVLLRPTARIFDLDVQQSYARGRHDLLWGGGWRRGSDGIEDGIITVFRPPSLTLDWWNAFLQDRVELGPSTTLTAGLRLEHNDFTGLEWLPGVRLAHRFSGAHLAWGAVSRAVRAPSRLDKHVFFPSVPPFLVVGGPDFESEVAWVYQLGWRAQPRPDLGFSLTGFYHDWEDLRSGTAVPVELVNQIDAEVYGVEAWGSWHVVPRWRLEAGFTTLAEHLRLEPGSQDPTGVRNGELLNDPDYTWQLRSAHDLPGRVELDLFLRQVAELPHPEVPRYTALDARLGWRVFDDAPSAAGGAGRGTLELAVTGRNLLDDEHAEFGAPESRSVLGRTVDFRLTWRR
jgi:iron complex outermembrane receptor protein